MLTISSIEDALRRHGIAMRMPGYGQIVHLRTSGPHENQWAMRDNRSDPALTGALLNE